MNRKKNPIMLYFLLILPLIYISVFTFYPIVKMVIMSFFNWKIGFNQTSSFVGIRNYIRVLGDPIAIRAIVNTFAYMFVTVPLQMVIGLLIAQLINSIRKGSLFFKLGYYLPVITSWVIVAMLFKYIFANRGLLNYFLKEIIFLTPEPFPWLSSRWSALFVAMMLGVWKGIGWNMIIFLAALQAVPKQYYEVAQIEGLNRWKQFTRVTLPSIRGTILFVMVMLCIGAFNTYTPIAVLTGGNPAHQTEVVLTWMYFQTFSASNKMGYSAALSVIVAIIIAFLTIIIFRTSLGKDSK